MTDKERILTYLLINIYPYATYMPQQIQNFSAKYIQKGDLVLAKSSGIHDFTVGYVTAKLTEDEMVVREIGGTRTCRIGNELFYKFDTARLDKNMLLEGVQYEIFTKVKKALVKYSTGLWSRIFYPIDFEFEDKIVTVYLRKHHGDYVKDTAPKISFNYSKKTTLKEIIAVLEATLKEDK